MVRSWHNRCSMLKNYWHFFFFDKQEEINSLLSFIYVKSLITIILTSNALIRQKCHRIGIRYEYQWDTNTNVPEEYWAKKKINFLFWYDLDTFEIQRVPIRYWRMKKKRKRKRKRIGIWHLIFDHLIGTVRLKALILSHDCPFTLSFLVSTLSLLGISLSHSRSLL